MVEFDLNIINERLKKIMNVKEDQDVAAKLKIDRKNYSRYKRSNKIPYKEIFQYCLENNILINSLLTGDDPLALKTITFSKVKDIGENELAIPYYENINPSAPDKVFVVEPKNRKYLLMDKNKNQSLNTECEAFKSFDDAMIPLIKENSIVFFDKSKTNFIDSGIYIFIYEDKIYLRVLAHELETDGIKAVSLNQIYPVLKIESMDKFKILGKFLYSS